MLRSTFIVCKNLFIFLFHKFILLKKFFFFKDPPKFEVPYGENDYSDDVIPVGKAYGIKGRDTRIPCHVIDSNPPVHQFKFYNGQTQDIHPDNIRYSLEHDVPNHTATLIVSIMQNLAFDQLENPWMGFKSFFFPNEIQKFEKMKMKFLI